MKSNQNWTWALATVAAATVAACGGGGDAAPQDVSVSFVAVAGATPIDCSSNLTGLGTTPTPGGATGGLRDLRFYISDVKLVNARGQEVPLSLGADDNFNATVGDHAVTLVDLEDKTGTCVDSNNTEATNTEIKGTVPAGTYTGIRMTLGVPFEINHTDQTADLSQTPAVINNAVNPGMAWSWAGGRKFTKIEVTNSTWTSPVFNVHLGSTGCTGTNPAAGEVDSCARPNRVNFGFTAFNPATQQVAVDVQALLAGNNVTVNGGGATGCMSGQTDPECPAVFERLGLDLATGTTVGDGSSQQLFKVVSK